MVLKYTLAALSVVSATKTESFGPSHCVSISRSDNSGTCLLNTNCQNANLDDVEFAFTCKNGDKLQKHSFGKGGFDAVEEFDTEVKCQECGIPQSVVFSQRAQSRLIRKATAEPKKEEAKPEEKKAETKAEKKAEAKVDAADKAVDNAKKDVQKIMQAAAKADVNDKDYGKVVADLEKQLAEAKKQLAAAAKKKKDAKMAAFESSKVRYGPKNCISTWHEGADGTKGACKIQTDCEGADAAAWKEYNIGFICDNDGEAAVRHLFGTDSFSQKEVFNTNVKCEKCLGLDHVSERVGVEAEVKGLSTVLYDTLKDMKAAMSSVKTMETEVKALNGFKDEVEKMKAPGPPGPPPPQAQPAAQAGFLVEEAIKAESNRSEDFDDDDDDDE